MTFRYAGRSYTVLIRHQHDKKGKLMRTISYVADGPLCKGIAKVRSKDEPCPTRVEGRKIAFIRAMEKHGYTPEDALDAWEYYRAVELGPDVDAMFESAS